MEVPINNSEASYIYGRLDGTFPKEIHVIQANTKPNKELIYIPEKTATAQIHINNDTVTGHVVCSCCNTRMYSIHMKYCSECGAKIIKQTVTMD